MMAMDRLQALKVFVAVAEAESFAAGARALGLSAPSATRGVNELETSLGVRLFTRTTRQVRLTDVGRTYLDDIREALARLQDADDTAAGTATMPVGRLRLTCPNEFGRIYVSPILTEYLDMYPAMTADVVMVDRVVNMIEEGFDVAVRIGPLPSSNLVAVRVGQVRRVVCGAPSYFAKHGVPQSPADLAEHQIVDAAPVNTARDWRFAPGKGQFAPVSPRMIVTSIGAAIEVARSGWGLTRVLSYQIGPDLEAGTLRTVLDAYEPDILPIHLVHVEGRHAATKVRSFVDLATRRLRDITVLRGAALHRD